jgi:putative transcriptional regulator
VAPALESDWREFRAKLLAQEKNVKLEEERARAMAASGENLKVLEAQNPKLASAAPWAHVIAAPEKGCLLVAADHEFRMSQQYFHHAVILVLEHHENGSMGIILNRPTQYDMGYVSGDVDGVFAKNALYFGGDVGDGTVSFLHGREDVKGSVEVLPGMYLGGYDSACALVEEQGAKPDEFKFFARYCGWAPGQLESECERGVWFPVAGAKELALKQVIQLPKPLWREVLELCGGELAEISAKAYREQETGLASSEVEIDVDEA